MRRAQVFVEALIVEVAADKAARIRHPVAVLQGIGPQRRAGLRRHQLRRARHSGNNIIDGAVNLGASGRASTSASSTARSPFRASAPSPTSRSSRARSRQHANANILSTPTLLTLDNEEARIIVGQNVPFITGQYATTGADATVHAVPDDRAQGRRPDAARQAADHRGRQRAPRDLPGSFAHRVDQRPIRPASCTNKRALESSVIVDDGADRRARRAIQDSLTDGSDSVPVARRLPVVGALFRYDTRNRSKTNLHGLSEADGGAHGARRHGASRPSATIT